MKNSTGLQSKSWKRNLVLLAKNSHVWLAQLSAKYHTSITQLDQIPEEEIAQIASRGFNGLWLVGVWHRSPASSRIKHLYGHRDAIASAYSIYEYKIAEDLGGESALQRLRDKAAAHHIRLACDMVPNHTGLDAPWTYQHPDWYISTEKNPCTDFKFNSTNLSENPSANIYLEEGYYNQTGAAEVFKFVPQPDGKPVYIYHGNDGTSMPWNDTAQLNYLNPQTRQAVMEEILTVARRFKIIRLDAAMTLVRKHFKRLWFPAENGKKFIPTRDQFPMQDDVFDQLMPEEFWKEVIERINAEVPDTLFIAEAFWLMEKYFIEEIGMHRVYNSAFMHQLRDEKNEEFKDYLKDILKSDPVMLERFVNFLTTPDEKPAIEQFGKSDKYFGACRLMACMPGLPMFGHGQWDGLSERYGMDIEQPTLDEKPDDELVQKHNKFITPLLQQRLYFSSVENFRLYDFLQDEGPNNHNVIIFSNRYSDNTKEQRVLVIFNNSSSPASGSIHMSIPQLDPQQPDHSIHESLFTALGLENQSDSQVQFKDSFSKDQLSMDVQALRHNGLILNLEPYESRVYFI